MAGEVSQEEFDRFIASYNLGQGRIEKSLDQIKSQVEGINHCVSDRVTREECSQAKEGLWGRINKVERLVYIGIGIALALEVIVIPIILVVLRG